MKKLMLGNEAVALGAWEAGARVVTAYPGTPSTEITENAAKYAEIYAEWAPNEKVAMETAIGAAVAGARTMVCMKHVGLNVAADPLFTVSYTGINAGLVIAVADDPGMFSSQNEQDSRYYARAAHIPMLEPSDSEECRDFVKLAFELSEEYDTPVLLRLTTRVAHSRSLVEPGERTEVPLKPYVKNFRKYAMMPAPAIARHRYVEERENKLAEAANSLPINKIVGSGDMKIVASGISYDYVREALPDAKVLKLGLSYPLPEKLIRDFAGDDTLTVIEELEPLVEKDIKAMGIPVIGKEKLTIQGEYSAALLRKAFLGEEAVQADNSAVPARPPALCPGCPHRAFYYIASKLKLTVTGDIGCYTLGALAPLSAVDTTVCMGASIGMAFGFEKAMGEEAAKKVIAVIGDSTFYHSGITGLVEMVYNGGHGTVCILDNSTTGMTGHQENPGTGKDIRGEIAPAIDLVGLVHSLGIEHVAVVDPNNLTEMERVLREETSRGELSVIIVRRPCILKVKDYKPALKVNPDKCKSCLACMKLGCPAIVRNQGRGVRINPSLCVGCGVCTGVCRFGAIGGEQ